MGTTDDLEGVGRTMGALPDRPFLLSIFSATPTLVGVLDAVLVAAIVALGAMQIGFATAVALIAGAVAGIVAFFVWAFVGEGQAIRQMARHEPRLPAK